MGEHPKYTCPCCGYLTLDEAPPGSFDICPVCDWEDDRVQFADPDFQGGANEVSLREARRNYEAFGASDKRSVERVRSPRPDECPTGSLRLRDLIRDVLVREWDPVGVQGIPGSPREYDDHILGIERRVQAGCNARELSDYLHTLEATRMGRTDCDPACRRRASNELVRLGSEFAEPQAAENLVRVEIDYVLDTNVMIDVLGLHPSTNRDPQRRTRAHHALSMCLILNRTASKTWHLHRELLRILKGSGFMEHDSLLYGTDFVHFVKERLMPDWSMHSDFDLDYGISGNDCDRLIVEQANERGAPVLSNEASPNGTIRATAKRLGVPVMTTADFCQQNPLSPEDWDAFFCAFSERLPEYVTEQGGRTEERLAGFREWLCYIAGRHDPSTNQAPG